MIREQDCAIRPPDDQYGAVDGLRQKADIHLLAFHRPQHKTPALKGGDISLCDPAIRIGCKLNAHCIGLVLCLLVCLAYSGAIRGAGDIYEILLLLRRQVLHTGEEGFIGAAQLRVNRAAFNEQLANHTIAAINRDQTARAGAAESKIFLPSVRRQSLKECRSAGSSGFRRR